MSDIANLDNDRLARMEQNLEEIKTALLGDVSGKTGLLGRVREREQTAEAQELRILRLETLQERMANLDELGLLQKKVERHEEQIQEWRTQIKTAWWIVTIGGASGVISLLSRIVELIAQ